MKYFKKCRKTTICLTVILALLLCTLCGCGNAIDPVGEYERVGVDTTTVKVMAYSSEFVRPVSIKIDVAQEGYSFTDLSYKGTAEIEEDHLVLNREESISTFEDLKEMQDRRLEENPDLRRDAYYIYDDCLISTSSSVAVEYGTLPEKDFADFGIEYIYDSPFSMDFFEDGSCEFEGETILEEEIFAEGEYEIDGQMLNITLKKYSDDSGIKSVDMKFSLFISDGQIYDGVYQKIK